VGLPAGSSVVPFSLVRGGPFHRILVAVRLSREDGRDAYRQSLALVALTWVPLVALAVAERLATHRWSAFVLNPAVHVRLLVTLPLLLVAEQVLHTLCGRCMDRFVQSGLVSDGLDAAGRVVARATRLRDSTLPEAALAVAAVAAGQAALWGLVNPQGPVTAPSSTAATSAALVWWAIVSLPCAQFLLYRSLWRWTLWSVVLWGLASLDLRPVAVHPDRRGGLSFLAQPTLGFAIVVMAIDCLVAGNWGGQMIFDGVPLQSLAAPYAEIAVAGLVVALGPLCVFTKRMWRARFEAIWQYDLFALRYTRLFQEKWIVTGDTEELLGTSDIQSMADLANTLAIVRSMRVAPFGAREVMALLAAIGLPMVPLLLAAVPLHELLRRTAGVFLGAAQH
jgi:hypothetical protein